MVRTIENLKETVSSFENDKKSLDNYTSGKTNKIDMFALQRVCLTELVKDGWFNGNKICGYNREQIKKYVASPDKHRVPFIKLIRFMYLHSGYFKKIIHYHCNLALSNCWTIDTEIKNSKFYNIGEKDFKDRYFKFVKEVNSFNLDTELFKILLNVMLFDACFGYIIETSEGKTIYYFDPEDCVITGYIDGIPTYSVRVPSLKSKKWKEYPDEIKLLFDNSDKNILSGNNYVTIPYRKSICIKYHEIFDFLYPPFFFIIKEILDIEDFKDLEKTRVENEIYKILALKIPTTDEGNIALGDELVTPFAELASNIVADSIGVLPTPFDPTPIEFTTNTSNNINNVQNAIDELYSEVGVSKSLLSGASSGSELKISIEVDSAEIYRLLGQISRVINFHCKLRLPIESDYGFKFRYLDVTAFNQKDKSDEILKLAQASCPVKLELMSTIGHNPAKMFGNEFVENQIFKFTENWQPMKTSYTSASSDLDDNGRPKKEETEIEGVTQTGIDNDSNDPDNRV